MKVLNFWKIIFAILSIVAVTFLIPIITAIFCNEYGMILPFVIPMTIVVLCFLIVYLFTKGKPINLTIRSTFLVVACGWLFSAFFCSIPLYLSGYFPSFTDAVFEGVSGITTTGATILADVEILPRSLNLWRCQTHWLGGMGIVALTVALFPLLGVGGFQLIKAETTGPEKGKVTPKITTTAKVLWLIYLFFTVIETVLLMFAGMDFIDALSHAFSTLGTGGFSTKNSSIAFYNSASIEWICMLFMFLAGVNFSLFFYMFRGKFSEVSKNTEFKAYIAIVFIATSLVAIIIRPQVDNIFESIRYSLFQVLTVMTTTGFSTFDYTQMLAPAQLVIFTLFFLGGSSGSTSGGVKIIRWVILGKQLRNEMMRTLHPHGVFSIRLNGKVGRKDVVFSVASFITCYMFLVFITTFVGTIFNLDLFSAFSGALTMVGNVGPGFGVLGPSFNCGGLESGLKWFYMFAMIAGRLELYTLIIFFFAGYWKK